MIYGCALAIKHSVMASYNIILLYGDIALNPGPIRWPSTVCGKCLKLNQRALLCDLCSKWSHILRVGVNEIHYKVLSEATEDFNWPCLLCLFEQLPCSVIIDYVINSCDSLFDSVLSSDYCSANPYSLPCICLSSQSVMNKVPDFKALIVTEHPDIVSVTESFLDSSISDCECFPKGFQLFHCDRSHHG